MTTLRTWLLSVIAASLLISILSTLLPKEKCQPLSQLVGGMILLLLIVRPVLHIDWSMLTRSFERWQIELDRQTEEYRKQESNELSAIISEQTGAYIQTKAASMGIVCCAVVGCSERDGIPFPVEVVLDIPYHVQLSQIITSELDIDSTHQHWQEGAG